MAEAIKNLKTDINVAKGILKKYELNKKLLVLGARNYFGKMFNNGELNTDECADLNAIIKDVDSMIEHWKEVVKKAQEDLDTIKCVGGSENA